MSSPDDKLTPEQRGGLSTRLWSEEVALAEACCPPPKAIGYLFSNGRTFDDGPGPYRAS